MFYSKNFKKIKHIKHCFFSRRGGFSSGLYKSLNCGKGSKDKRKNILKNLEYVSKKMCVKKSRLILMHQTHSNKVIEIKDIIVAISPKSGILEPKSIPKTKDAPTNPNKTPIHCFKFTFSLSIGPLNIFVKIGWRVTIKAAIPVGIPIEIE